MLVAPAGYGKTTLARQWLEGKQAVWYTATPASVDVAALAAGLQQALTEAVPDAGLALRERLPVTPWPEGEAETLASMLADDLASWPLTTSLVVDDYQLLAGTPAAERFIHVLLQEAPLIAIVISRRRPAWASSRRILYGEIFELNRDALAMTHDEARLLLDGRIPDPAGLLELAKGWPAVLGIAAMSGASLPDLVAAPHLFGFFADEVYRRLDRRIRRRLIELALYEPAGRRIALQALKPDDAERLVHQATDSGFLTETTGGHLEMHPLLRSFLGQKLDSEPPREKARVVTRAARRLISSGLWDEAYQIISRFGEDALLTELIEASMDALLAQGRTSTLSTWVSQAPKGVPAVWLAAAELALREGHYHESETLALLAARDLVAPDLVGRAWLIAGRAAHVASKAERSLKHYEAAAAIAESESLRRRAEFGHLQAAVELEADDGPSQLSSLASRLPLEPEDQVLFADRKIGVETRYGLRVDFESARAASQLLGLVADPMTRTSFRNVFGYALAASAQFTEALQVTRDQLEDAERCRLEFVIPYALTIKALVCSGRRDYVDAAELLAEADERAVKTGDWTARHITHAVRMRLCISQAAFDVALSPTLDIQTSTTASLRAELTACRALAYAGAGDLAQASLLAEAAASSVGVEATVNSNAARAIVELRAGTHERGVAYARLALSCATRTGLVESFVAAYRGFPDLLVCLLEDKADHADLSYVLRLMGDDSTLAVSVHEQSDKSVLDLSPREKEVLGLLAQGLSNVEIGHKLFISPVTVKVHVRHIFEKLGVKSRAAAALRAAQLGR